MIGYDYKLKALENLLDAGVSFHPAVMLSFNDPVGYKRLKDKIAFNPEREYKSRYY